MRMRNASRGPVLVGAHAASVRCHACRTPTIPVGTAVDGGLPLVRERCPACGQEHHVYNNQEQRDAR